MNLTFEPIQHKYYLDGKEIPSVSEILEKGGLSDMSMVPQKILERSGNWGQAVHKLTELYDKKTLDRKTVDDNLLYDLNNWGNFNFDYKPEVLDIEYQVVSIKWQYAGTLDRIIKIENKNILLDIKTPTNLNLKALRMQLALYQIAYEEMAELKIDERWCIQLLGKKGYIVTPFDRPEYKNDLSIAKSFVQTYHYKGGLNGRS